ncbi:hypothetical protein DRJ25_01080 [Candidatus Woesearchaeota archaeon]|nr:MAG: hypothetical protein DRJ25_01080 [Candidatus Woesearchaeota archaeon]
MKGIFEYEQGKEEETKKLLRDYGLKYIRTVRFANYIIFKYEEGEELNAVAMAMRAGNLSRLSLEKIIRTKEVENGI